MKLEDLCKGIISLPEGYVRDISVTGVVSDSRQVEAGNIFVAVLGYNADGHDYIDDAIAKGAGIVLVENDVPVKAVPVIKVKDSRRVLGLLSNRFFGESWKNMLVAGITGTNGKTTVAFLLESVFSHAGIKTGLIGTLVYRWHGYEVRAERTTPEAIEIHSILKRMKDCGVKAVVMEVSSHALALNRVSGMKFKVAVFTNLTREHLDFHNTMQDYGKTKARLFGMLDSGGIGIINGDDPVYKLMINAAKEKAVTYGLINKNVDYKIERVESTNKETTFIIRRGKKTVSIHTPLLGSFNVMNAAAAAVAGLELGLDEKSILKGISNVNRVRGRMEGIDTNQGFKVIIDYAHTPDALKNVLTAARDFTQDRLIVVFGCGGNRDRGKRPEMGRVASEIADTLFLTSDNPRGEDPSVILSDILEGIDSSKDAMIIEDRKEAIYTALNRANEGDTIVIAGKGHETYQEIDTKRIPFDDRLVVEEYLESLGEAGSGLNPG